MKTGYVVAADKNIASNEEKSVNSVRIPQKDKKIMDDSSSALINQHKKIYVLPVANAHLEKKSQDSVIILSDWTDTPREKGCNQMLVDSEKLAQHWTTTTKMEKALPQRNNLKQSIVRLA